MTAKPPPARKSNGIAASVAGVTLIVVAAILAPFGRHSQIVATLLWAAAIILMLMGLGLIIIRYRVSTVNLLLFVVSGMVGLVTVEVALALVDVPPLKRIVWHAPDLVPWWGAETRGQVRFIPEKYDGPWVINPQGFPDTDYFTTQLAAKRRILLLGDSFAYGASASSHSKSFAELLDTSLDATAPTTIWNLAIPGTGQQEQLELLASVDMEAQIVLATLYRNDFTDNLLPPWRFYVFSDGAWVDRFEATSAGFKELTPTQAYRRAFAVQGLHDLPKVLRSASAIAGLVRRFFVPHIVMEAKPTPGYERTKILLSQLQLMATARNAVLIVLLIPDREDFPKPSTAYTDSLQICEELGIISLDLHKGGSLNFGDYAPPPDTHWNDSGHAKVAVDLDLSLNIAFARWTNVDTETNSPNGIP